MTELTPLTMTNGTDHPLHARHAGSEQNYSKKDHA